MTLEEFLRERIVEDEAVARAVEEKTRRPGQGLPDYYEHATTSAAEIIWDIDYGQGGYTITAARVLAECEAKRRIIDRETAAWKMPLDGSAPDIAWSFLPTSEEAAEQMAYLEAYATRVTDTPTLRDLAVVYQDHPDHQEEWRP